MSFKWPSKSPEEVLDYSLDWSRLIETPVIISSVSWFIEYEGFPKVAFPVTSTVYGLRNNAAPITGKDTTIFLSQGVLNRTYKLTCRVTDSLSRVFERSVTIQIRNR